MQLTPHIASDNIFLKLNRFAKDWHRHAQDYLFRCMRLAPIDDFGCALRHYRRRKSGLLRLTRQKNICQFSFCSAQYFHCKPGCEPLRICVYKSYEAPEITLFLREGAAMPAHVKSQHWRHFKVVISAEMRADLLTQIEVGNGCLLVNLGASVTH